LIISNRSSGLGEAQEKRWISTTKELTNSTSILIFLIFCKNWSILINSRQYYWQMIRSNYSNASLSRRLRGSICSGEVLIFNQCNKHIKHIKIYLKDHNNQTLTWKYWIALSQICRSYLLVFKKMKNSMRKLTRLRIFRRIRIVMGSLTCKWKEIRVKRLLIRQELWRKGWMLSSLESILRVKELLTLLLRYFCQKIKALPKYYHPRTKELITKIIHLQTFISRMNKRIGLTNLWNSLILRIIIRWKILRSLRKFDFLFFEKDVMAIYCIEFMLFSLE